MEDALAFSPNSQTSWVTFVTDRRKQGQSQPHHGKYEDAQEVKVDKTELHSEIDALLASISVAIGRMEHKKHSSTRIQEFEMVRGEAGRVLAALDASGSGFQLGELSRQESAIRGMFEQESDQPLAKGAGDYDDDDDDDDDDNPKPRRAAPMDEGAATQSLGRRRGRMHKCLHHHVAIRNETAGIADDSKTDLLAAVAVASAIYGGEKYEEVLAKRKDEMLSAGTPEPAATERLALIEQEGKNICASMGKDASETHACMVNAAENIGNLHLSQHQKETVQSLGDARASLVEYNDPHLLTGFDHSIKELGQRMGETHTAFKEGIKTTRDGLPALSNGQSPITTQEGLVTLVSATGLGEVFDTMDRHAHAMEKPLETQTAILDSSWRALEQAQTDLHEMKHGKYKGNSWAIAKAAGTTTDALYKEVADHQRHNHVHSETGKELNARIESINAKWKSLMHGENRNTGTNISISL